MNANPPKRKNSLADNLEKLFWPAVAVLAVLAADQVTKWWAVNYLAVNSPVEVLGRFFMLTLVFNEGGALGTNFGSSAYYLVSSALILLFLLYYIYVSRDDRLIAVPLSFIAGGAIGNIIDRIRLGSVIDFVDVDFFDISIFSRHLERWWTFNLADAVITCSIAFLLITMLFFRKRPTHPVHH